MAVCRLMFLDFMHNTGRLSENGVEKYDDSDIHDSIAYAEWLIEMGYTTELLDDFNLRDFIEWAKQKLLHPNHKRDMVDEG